MLHSIRCEISTYFLFTALFRHLFCEPMEKKSRGEAAGGGYKIPYDSNNNYYLILKGIL